MGGKRATANRGSERGGEDLRVVKTRRALHAALRELSKRLDYSQITVTALAREACINRKTFYAHYRSPDDLVAEVIAQDIEEICREASTAAAGRTGRAEVEALTGLLLHAVDECFDEQLSLLRGLGFLSLAGMVIDPMEKVVMEERERRGLPETGSLRGDIACYVGCLLAGYAQWRFESGGTETLDDVIARVNRITAGLANDILR